MASIEVLTALESLHKELEKLEPAIKHVETAQLVIKTVKEIPQKHLDLLTAIKFDDSKHKDGLKELFEKEITSISKENEKLLKTTTEIQQQLVAELEVISKLMDKIQNFFERIEKINFPERLDKIDANISGIMAAIQSVQSRLDSVERNMIDRLKDNFDFQKETQKQFELTLGQNKTEMLSTIDNNAKNQKTVAYFTCFLICIGFMAIFLFLN